MEAKFYEGKIADGKIKILYPSGEFYEGDFYKNKRNGKGTLYYTNGDIYEGEWLDDKRLGKAKFYFSDGS